MLKKTKLKLLRDFGPFIFLLTLCIPAAFHLFYPGYFSVHDLIHPALIYEMFQNFSYFQFPPRWAPDLSWGYGYPYFHYIYPLPYYLGSWIYQINGSLISSIKLLHIIAIFGAAFAMYWYTSTKSKISGLVSAIVYTYAPYRAVAIYVRGALGEVLVYIWVPLALLGIDRIKTSHRRNYWVVFTGLMIALIILSQNIGAIVFLPFLFAYSLITASRSLSNLKNFFISFILGLGFSAYFWLPAILDKPLITGDATYNLLDHFPFISQLIIPFWGYGASLWGPGDGMSFQIGLVNLFIIFIFTIFLSFQLIHRKIISPKYTFLIGSLILVIFLMNVRSYWIWQLIPFSNFVQFPWRLLSVVILVVAIMAGLLFDQIRTTIYRILAFCFLIIFFVTTSLPYFQPDKHLSTTDDQIIDRFFPVDPRQTQPVFSHQYKNQQEEYLPLIKTTQSRPSEYPQERFTSRQSQINVDSHSPFDYELTTLSPVDDHITANIYAYPLWQVSLDRQPISYQILPPHGIINIPIPSGSHHVSLKLIQSGTANWGNLLSFSTLLVSVLLFILPKVNIRLYSRHPKHSVK